MAQYLSITPNSAAVAIAYLSVKAGQQAAPTITKHYLALHNVNAENALKASSERE